MTMQIDGLHAIECREGQLWLLAFFFIFLLAVGVFAMDSAYDLRAPVGPLETLLSSYVARVGLLVVVLLICVYFRERVKALHSANRALHDCVRQHQHHLQEKARLLHRWGEVSHALITSSNLDELLDLVVHTAIEFIDGDTASLMLVDDAGRELHIAAACGLSQEVIRSTRIAIGDGVSGFVAQHGEAVLLTADTADPRLAPRLRRGEDIRSAISVPLVLGGKVIGTLNVNRTRSAQDFDRRDLGTLSLFATQAVLAIEKARLYAASQQQVDRLSQMLAELERTQAQLVQSEKLASLGLLAGGVAHEINNPLMVILGRAELLLQDAAADSRVARDLATIERETTRIAEIVRNLLKFSREGRDGSFQPVDINRAIEAVISMTRHILTVDNVMVETELDANLPPVLGNSGQLQQVFTNIIINAFHAMPNGGRLAIRTASSEDRVIISFTDSGFGIAPENLSRIFDPFFTTKQEGKGTGLGLTVSYGIIQSHHGEIRVESEPGHGTCFSIELPIHERAEAGAGGNRPEDAAPTAALTSAKGGASP